MESQNDFHSILTEVFGECDVVVACIEAEGLAVQGVRVLIYIHDRTGADNFRFTLGELFNIIVMSR